MNRLENKSGPDKISVELLKKCFSSIYNPLLKIIDNSLALGKVPTEIKLFTIIHIPKVNKIFCKYQSGFHNKQLRSDFTMYFNRLEK